MTHYDGVKYYSNNDLSIGYSLEQSENVINAFNSEKEFTDVNETIELYNIQQLMDSGVVLKKWDEQTISRLKSTCTQFNAKIGRYFSTINNDNFIKVFQSVDALYVEDFWLLFSKYKVFSKIDSSVFVELLTNENVVLWPILEHKDVVAHYDTELASFMRTSDQSAKLLLDHFCAETKRNYYFPKSFLPSEYEAVFESYIDSEHPNPNYLNLIANSQSSKDCPISPKLRQKAKHRFEKELNKRAENAPGIQYGIGIGFGDIDSYISVDNTNALNPQIVYDKKWIEDNLDYPTLLNNFRYVFEQVDFCWRSNLVSLPYHLGILERTLGITGKKEYRIGTQFQVTEMKALGEIRGYRHLLKNKGVEIEAVFQWFFEDYLKNEFQAEGFWFRASSSGASIVERIKNIASEMDGSLKQFRTFLEDGDIDNELFEMTSEHLVFSQLGSFFPDKYAYSNSDSIKSEMFLLFSDQSRITYTEKTKAKYRAFGDMITNEKMKLSDFAYYQTEPIKWLISRGVIGEDEDRTLQIKKDRFTILKDLYVHEVICPHYYITYRATLDNMIASGDLRYGSSLFSEPEQDYLNYTLNQAEFSNGLDLRNKYLHGSYPRDSKVQEEDYDHMLMIMALVIMKINEEFCLKYPIKEDR